MHFIAFYEGEKYIMSKFLSMFDYNGKTAKVLGKTRINTYQDIYLRSPGRPECRHNPPGWQHPG